MRRGLYAKHPADAKLVRKMRKPGLKRCATDGRISCCAKTAKKTKPNERRKS